MGSTTKPIKEAFVPTDEDTSANAILRVSRERLAFAGDNVPAIAEETIAYLKSLKDKVEPEAEDDLISALVWCTMIGRYSSGKTDGLIKH